MKIFGQWLLLSGMARFAFGASQSAPEVDASAVALVSGAILVLRSRKR